MPELPEVETVRRTLEGQLRGREIVAVDVFQTALRLPVASDFGSRLLGATVVRVSRRGKYLLMLLDRNLVWVCHLGMSGKLVFSLEALPRQKHDHIVVRFLGGGELRFNDPRRFGLCVVMTQTEVGSWPPVAHLGIEPLSGELNGERLYAFMHRSQRRVRDLLLDQQVIAGLGNIYVNEILFRAGVRPTTRAARIPRRVAHAIAREIPIVLELAIRARGTSLVNYRDGNDRRGAFQQRLKVYDRAGENCLVCGAVIKRQPVGNRSTYYCPRCQK